MDNSSYAGMDSWAVLGVPKGSSEEVVKRAYRKLAMRYHPDRHANGGPEAKTAEESFKRAKGAYERIIDGTQAREESESGGAWQPAPGAAPRPAGRDWPGWAGINARPAEVNVSSLAALFGAQWFYDGSRRPGLARGEASVVSEFANGIIALASRYNLTKSTAQVFHAYFLTTLWRSKDPLAFDAARHVHEHLKKTQPAIAEHFNPWVYSIQGGLREGFNPAASLFGESITEAPRDRQIKFHQMIAEQFGPSIVSFDEYWKKVDASAEEPFGVALLRRMPEAFDIYASKNLINIGDASYPRWAKKQNRADALALLLLTSNLRSSSCFDYIISLEGAAWLRWALDSDAPIMEGKREELCEDLALFAAREGKISNAPLRSELGRGADAWVKERELIGKACGSSFKRLAEAAARLTRGAAPEGLVRDAFTQAILKKDIYGFASALETLSERAISLAGVRLGALTLAGALFWQALSEPKAREMSLRGLGLLQRLEPDLLDEPQGFGRSVSKLLAYMGWELPAPEPAVARNSFASASRP